ncbi:aspartate racemase [Selenomonas ruminantium]|uniref:Aspartate racemase n=1 Tax=Selenomonas ruminantium TaxID=971 RepID=A0A1M6S0G7_SELRU|nr:amino acid racemase [Selenomonas ruminantium]SHK38312.1 aspartate racemase [Selenomonas ruminantium]
MKTIGIMGGMGPMATVDLMRKIIMATPAACDQEHIPMLVDNNSQIPDRTKAIKGLGASPAPEMVKTAKRLMMGGADFIIIACNTAHYFLPEILPQISIPVLSIIDVAVASVREKGYKNVGLLATSGTISTGLYQNSLAANSIQCIAPAAEHQHLVDDMIYDGVKANNAGYDTSAIRELLADMQRQGAEAFILGCTEVPVAVSMYGLEGTFIDPTDELAKAAVRFAREETTDDVLIA